MKPFAVICTFIAGTLFAILPTMGMAAEITKSTCSKIGSVRVDADLKYRCTAISGKNKWVATGPNITPPIIATSTNTNDSVSSLTLGQLIWSDEFTGKAGNGLDPTVWSSNLGNYSNSSITINDPSLSTLDGTDKGLLTITPKKINDPSLYNGMCSGGKFCQFKAGRISTRNLLTVKYGYIEARIKMPVGVGNWPAFWMLRDGNYDSKVSTPGEIDITEWYGRYPTKSCSTLHFAADPADTKTATSSGTIATQSKSLSDDFHIYAMAWLPNSITFLLDGAPVQTFTSDQIKTWPFNNFFFLILNGGVGPQPNTIYGGTWDGWQESTMSVDWLRVWQLNGYGEVVKKTVPNMTPEQMLAQLSSK
jgi:beta-glucanase (GH16 family)